MTRYFVYNFHGEEIWLYRIIDGRVETFINGSWGLAFIQEESLEARFKEITEEEVALLI